MQGGAASTVQPVYPGTAKAARISGAVQVQVVIDEAGKVIEAKAVGGHPMLRAAAVQAAQQWTFKPTQLSGVPVKTQGVLTFNFALDGKTSGAANAPKPLPEEQRRQATLAKLHPSVAAIVARLAKKDTTPGADEAKFVSSGKAELQIWLTNKSEAAVEQLKQLGLEIVLNPQSSKLIIGRLPIEKLEALARLEVVRYVSPAELSRK